MRNADVAYGILPSEELRINERELQRRLGMRADVGIDPYTSSFPAVLEKCRKQLMEAARCRFAWRRMPLGFPEEGVCLLGEIRIASRDLCRNLRDCSEAVLMGVTLGLGADRLLLRLEKTAPSEHFITDAIASAAVESLCDRVDRQIREEIGKEGGTGFRPRYSPGYGDCSIEVQRPLLEQLSAGSTLGITLNEACFMTPVKSITAIMGIRK